MQVEEIKEYDVYIAFYKSNYAFWSRWIKWWTKSKYSHCEFYVNENLIGISTEQSVRIKEHKIDKEKWDIFKIKLNSDKLKEALIKFYSKTKGAKYDWKGIILAQVFNLRRDNKEKYTCSEWAIELIDSVYDVAINKNYITYTPQDLFNILKFYDIIEM